MLFWDMATEMDQLLKNARPNPAHYALVELESLGKEIVVVTQNVDNLHQEAGSSQVYELHGNARTASCVSCKLHHSDEFVKERLALHLVPKCQSCNSLIKSDVILFGEPLTPAVIMNAMEAAQEWCEVFIVIGSSLLVSPANLLPRMAKERATLIYINLGDTPSDSLADLIIREKAGEVLPKIVKACKEMS